MTSCESTFLSYTAHRRSTQLTANRKMQVNAQNQGKMKQNEKTLLPNGCRKISDLNLEQWTENQESRLLNSFAFVKLESPCFISVHIWSTFSSDETADQTNVVKQNKIKESHASGRKEDILLIHFTDAEKDSPGFHT